MSANANDNRQEEDRKNLDCDHGKVDSIAEFGFTKSNGAENEKRKNNTSGEKEQNGNEPKKFSDILPKSYEAMDQEFLNYLKFFNLNSQKQEEIKSGLKPKFFSCVMIFMGAIIFFPYVLVFMFRNSMTDFTIVALSISSLAETLSAIIALPKIIAKYLFNKKEEENKIKIISDMQAYNRGKRE